MDPRYAEWIANFERTQLAEVRILDGAELTREERIAVVVRGRCQTATADMVRAFPELRRVRGHYGGAEHWWCEAPDGTTVDPTAKQFVPGRAYVEYTGPDPLGKCMNCGDYIWVAGFSGACSKDCEDDLREYYS